MSWNPDNLTDESFDDDTADVIEESAREAGERAQAVSDMAALREAARDHEKFRVTEDGSVTLAEGVMSASMEVEDR